MSARVTNQLEDTDCQVDETVPVEGALHNQALEGAHWPSLDDETTSPSKVDDS